MMLLEKHKYLKHIHLLNMYINMIHNLIFGVTKLLVQLL